MYFGSVSDCVLLLLLLLLLQLMVLLLLLLLLFVSLPVLFSIHPAPLPPPPPPPHFFLFFFLLLRLIYFFSYLFLSFLLSFFLSSSSTSSSSSSSFFVFCLFVCFVLFVFHSTISEFIKAQFRPIMHFHSKFRLKKRVVGDSPAVDQCTTC